MNFSVLWDIIKDPITVLFLLILIALFVYYIRKVSQVRSCNRDLLGASFDNGALDQLKQMDSIKLIAKNYEHSICFMDDKDKRRTSDFASDYFNLSAVLSVKKINRQAMGAAAGILVGIGVLGTFVGLSLAVAKIKMGAEVDIKAMWSSINTLLGGMKIAFVTSVAGMLLSSVYTFFEKIALNDLTKTCAQISDLLDDQYYISDLEKQNIETERRNEMFLKQIGTIVHDIKSIDDDANELTIGNMLRDIKQCNENQVNAINCVAEEVCRGLGEKFDELASKMVDAIQNPQGGLAGGVIEQLQSAINQMLVKLNENIDKGMSQKMDELGNQLKLAADSLKQMPSVMEEFSNKVREELNQIESRVTTMNESSAQTGEKLAARQTTLNSQTEKLVSDFNAGIKSSKELLDSISSMLKQLSAVHQQIGMFTEKMQATSSRIESAINNLDSAQSGFVKQTSDTFKEIRDTNEAATAMTKNAFDNARDTIQKTFDNTDLLVKNSEQLAHTYAQEFENIRMGMGDIFKQMEMGLIGYSEAVKNNTGNIFAAYSKEVNTALDNLHAVVTQLCLMKQPNNK